MNEPFMEQYRLRRHRRRRNACIAAVMAAGLVLAIVGGAWWTAGDGGALVPEYVQTEGHSYYAKGHRQHRGICLSECSGISGDGCR